MRQIFEFPKILINWLFRFFRWLIVEPKKFWITLLLPIFVYIIVCWLNPVGISVGQELIDIFEKRFRLTGLFLELSGIVLVVFGLNKTLKLHLGKHLLHIIPKWFKRFPKLIQTSKHIVISDHAIAIDTATSSVEMSTSNSDSSIENRVLILEEHFKQLHSQVQVIRRDFENESRILSDALNTERNERESGHKQVQQALKEFAVADVYEELMGIIWLFFGAISATASTELAKLFG